MPSLSASVFDWLLLLLLVAFSAMALRALYVWWKRNGYTRERFAFAGFFALLSFGGFFLGNLLSSKSIIGGLLFALLKPFGFIPQSALSSLTPLETALVIVLFVGLIWAYVRVFTSWPGKKSRAQHEQEQNRETASVLRDIKLLLSRRPEDREQRAPYQGDTQSDQDVLERPESLTWHERARKLWLLRHRGYGFDGEYDPARNCWLGEEKHTGALAVLACYQEAPQDLSALAEYARKVANKQGRTEIELILAVKNHGPRPKVPPADADYRLIHTHEAELLADLVDFSNYFADIRYRVERARLTDSNLTLQDTYTPSRYLLENKLRDHTLEGFIDGWLRDDNTQRQLALLGEYGQGKSTASLLLCYQLIKQRDEHPDTRIPILIELRGKNLRTLTPEELLATWAHHYDISVRALLHLHMAGRLLLIFEGFDEIDLSGDTETRIAHFRTLWGLNYRGAKIMVTGRPNFFLGSRELERALGNAEQTHTLHLAPFDLDQIADSLREADPSTREEILELARRDGKFREVVARPSLLYVVSVLWRREKLSERRRIDSALVMDLFIRRSLEHQKDKYDRPFMVLNSAERHYFMTGIAAYMAAKQLPNQIDGHRLEEAVGRLVDAIPDAVSQSVGAREQNEDARPLRNEVRLEWTTRRTEIMRKINTDVRACGLLVTDPSKDGHFKFAHKSYLELLQAQTISRLFANDPVEQSSGHSIANTWKLSIDDLQNSDEAMGFLAELLQKELYAQGLSEDPAVAKGLWDVLVDGKLPSRWTIAGLFKARWIAAASGLAGRLVGWFGVASRTTSALGLSTGLVAVAGAVTIAGAVTVTFAGATAVAGAVAGAQELVEQFGWLWPEALLLTFSIVSVGVLLGLVTGLATDFLSGQRTTVFKRLRLWHRACGDLDLSSEAIEQTAGKGMAELLAEAEARRAEGERG